tara:strand:+ start:637 stop:816 length:180 start_codon:yes stop_codon:yes gene_type:complete
MGDRIDDIQFTLSRMVNNDLPHIQQRLTKLETSNKWQTAILLVVLGAIIGLGIVGLGTK